MSALALRTVSPQQGLGWRHIFPRGFRRRRPCATRVSLERPPHFLIPAKRNGLARPGAGVRTLISLKPPGTRSGPHLPGACARRARPRAPSCARLRRVLRGLHPPRPEAHEAPPHILHPQRPAASGKAARQAPQARSSRKASSFAPQHGKRALCRKPAPPSAAAGPSPLPHACDRGMFSRPFTAPISTARPFASGVSA